MRNHRSREAFTLVELLVVIGIIAVLIGMLLPALNRARMSAKSVACQANLRSIGQVIQIYTVSNKGMLPIGYWDGACSLNGYTMDGNRATHWVLLLQSTLSNKHGNTWNTANNDTKVREMFLCPDAPGDYMLDKNTSGVTSYQSHPRLMPWFSQTAAGTGGWPPDGYPDGADHGPLKPYNMAKVKRPAEIALIFDSSLEAKVGTPGVFHPAGDIPVAFQLDSYGLLNKPFMTTSYEIPGTPSYMQRPDFAVNIDAGENTNKDNSSNGHTIRFRHMKDSVANVLMVDGHVQSFIFKNATNHDFKRGNINVNPPR